MTTSTFKIFKHNFWTNEWSRFLYEGHYYKFGVSDISKVAIGVLKGRTLVKYVVFTIPRVWLKEYQKGVFIEWREFPKVFQTKLEKYASLKMKKLPKEFEKELKDYFVKKIHITEKQAKVLMKLQGAENISLKKIRAIHKRIGLLN